jgi:hypothetical protein
MEMLPATTLTLEVNEKMLYGETLDEPERCLFSSKNKASFVPDILCI